MKLKLLLFENQNFKQTILKNTFWLVFAELVSKIPQLFTNILIIRYLSPESYGQFAFTFSLASLLATFCDLGLATLIIREVAKNKKNTEKYVNNVLSLKLILNLVGFLVILLMTNVSRGALDIKHLIYLSSVFVLFSSLTTIFNSVFQAFEQMEYLAVFKLLSSLSLCSLIYISTNQNLGINSIVLSHVYSAIIILVTTLALFRLKFARLSLWFNKPFCVNIIKEALPFGLISITASIFFQLGTIQLSTLVSNRATGIYSTAMQLILNVTGFLGLFFASLFPSLSKRYRHSKKRFYITINYVAKKVIIFSAIICLGLFLLSKRLILTLYGSTYSDSSNVFRILIISVFVLFLNTTHSEGLKIMGRQKDYFKILLIGTLFNFLTNLITIRLFQESGAALSMLCSSFVMTVLMIKRFKHFKKQDLKNDH